MIQAPGLGGKPSRGHATSATVERFLDSVLGKIDVAEGADQSGDGASELLSEDAADVGFWKLASGVEASHALAAWHLEKGTNLDRSADACRGLRCP